MRYRRLSAAGDYTFGAGSGNFWINDPQAVAQSVQTRLLLFTGEWFLDQTDGLPLMTEILGYGTKSLYDAAIRARILDTNGVTGIVSYQSTLNPATRALTVNVTIMTQYSTQPIPVPPLVL